MAVILKAQCKIWKNQEKIVIIDSKMVTLFKENLKMIFSIMASIFLKIKVCSIKDFLIMILKNMVKGNYF